MNRDGISIDHVGGQRVRQGQLRWRFPSFPSLTVGTGGGGDPPPPPDCCCSEAPGLELENARVDLRLLFDKLYGAANRVTVDGIWEDWQGNADCGDAGVRLPTQAYLAAQSEGEGLCGFDPPMRTIVNNMRDALVRAAEWTAPPSFAMKDGRKVLQLDASENPVCKGLDNVVVVFTPTYDCEHPLSLTCDFEGFPPNLKNRDERVGTCERICTHHYAEIEDQVDYLMTYGVIQFEMAVRSGLNCGGQQASRFCLATTTTVYEDAEEGDCCNKGCAPQGCDPCCIGPGATATLYRHEEYLVQSDLNTFFCDCPGVGNGCPPKPYRSNYISDDRWTVVNYQITEQIGPSFLDAQCNLRIPVRFTDYTWNRCTGDTGDCNPVLTVNETRTEVVTLVRQEVPGTSGREWWWGINAGCSIGADPPVEQACEGTITAYHEDDCFVGNGIETFGWCYETVTIDAANDSCGDPPQCISCPCPGPVESTNTVYTYGTVQMDEQACTVKDRPDELNACGRGTDIERALEFEVMIPEGCPDSGLTNTKRRDSRLPAPTHSWQAVTIAAPTVADPPCPGHAEDCKAEVCLIAWGELA